MHAFYYLSHGQIPHLPIQSVYFTFTLHNGIICFIFILLSYILESYSNLFFNFYELFLVLELFTFHTILSFLH